MNILPLPFAVSCLLLCSVWALVPGLVCRFVCVLLLPTGTSPLLVLVIGFSSCDILLCGFIFPGIVTCETFKKSNNSHMC